MRNICLKRPSWACAALVTLLLGSTAALPNEQETITPGPASPALKSIPDYEARYTSSSSKTGEFTLQVRTSGDGKMLSMVDTIPMENMVIVAQRVIDMETQLQMFSAGPYFAWGAEFIVGQTDGATYSWNRVPLEGGAPKRAAGSIQNDGYMSEMFSPLLASFMPRDVGSTFLLPASYARQSQTVTSEFDEYTVTGRERLETPSGQRCECWVVDKKTWGGSLERIWVAKEAPYVFKRHCDVGGTRSFVSELLYFSRLEK